MKRTLLSLVLCFALVPAVLAESESSSPAHSSVEESTLPKAPYVSIETAKKWRTNQRDFLFVDVRTPAEYKSGHLPGSINIPYDEMEKKKKTIPLDKPVVFYCTLSSWRAPYAANVMADAGYNNVYVLEGGASGWNSAGQVIEATDSSQKAEIVPKPKNLVANFEHPPVRAYKIPIDLNLEQLKEFDGKNGRPAYVAVGGTIYDVTLSRLWRGGEHDPSHGDAYAGKDLTLVLEKSPHGDKHLKDFPVVGRLVAKSE